MSSFLDPDDWPEAVVILSKDPFTVAGYMPRIVAGEGAESHSVHWREARHDRGFPVLEVYEQSADVFDFDAGGIRYRLLPMTEELYEKHVRKRTVGRPAFGSLRELLDTMRAEW